MSSTISNFLLARFARQILDATADILLKIPVSAPRKPKSWIRPCLYCTYTTYEVLPGAGLLGAVLLSVDISFLLV